MYQSDSLESSLWADDLAQSGRSAPTVETQNYTVKDNECLSEIVMRLTGSGNWRAVYELNKDAIGPNPNYLEPGTVLIIPDAVSEERGDDS